MKEKDRIDFVDDLARLDLDRQHRSGIAEVIFAQGKSFDQVVELSKRLAQAKGRVLVTRLKPEWLPQLAESLSPFDVELNERACLAVVIKNGSQVKPSGGVIGLLSAGTSDLPIAEEARVSAQEMGCEVIRHYDVGVAGLHRLVEPLREFERRNVPVIVVVAGMDGALPTLTKSLTRVPVIGVPTSVGYGLGQPGEAALMTMLHSCVPGLTVVNIDNGFGAGATAALIAGRCAEERGKAAKSE